MRLLLLSLVWESRPPQGGWIEIGIRRQGLRHVFVPPPTGRVVCDIPAGALYHGETRRRQSVEFTPELRAEVERCVSRMRELYQRGYTPKVKPTKACNACSLKELCLPRLMRQRSVAAYLRSRLEETE